MDIFKNDSQVLTIGNLSIENGTDKVVIHGDVAIGADDVGRTHAKMLYEFARNLYQSLDDIGQANTELTTDSPTNHTDDIVANPFV